MKIINRIKAYIGLQLCRFGLWLCDKTICWATDYDQLREHKEDKAKFEKLARGFRIQASDLRVVKKEDENVG